jgi:hypothetical protein
LLLKLKMQLLPAVFCAGCCLHYCSLVNRLGLCTSNNLLAKPMFLTLACHCQWVAKQLTLTLMMLGRGLNLGCWQYQLWCLTTQVSNCLMMSIRTRVIKVVLHFRLGDCQLHEWYRWPTDHAALLPQSMLYYDCRWSIYWIKGLWQQPKALNVQTVVPRRQCNSF